MGREKENSIRGTVAKSVRTKEKVYTERRGGTEGAERLGVLRSFRGGGEASRYRPN